MLLDRGIGSETCGNLQSRVQGRGLCLHRARYRTIARLPRLSSKSRMYAVPKFGRTLSAGIGAKAGGRRSTR